MATIPVHTIEVIERFGPHLARSKGARLDSGVEPDKTVKTHCCFCGQQCGIERVADGRRLSSRHVYRGNLPAGQGDRFEVSVFYSTLLLLRRSVRMVGDVRRVRAQPDARAARLAASNKRRYAETSRYEQVAC
jgi:hypothetical protein